MIKVHNDFGTSGLHDFGAKFKLRKKRMTVNDRVLTSLLVTLCPECILNLLPLSSVVSSS